MKNKTEPSQRVSPSAPWPRRAWPTEPLFRTRVLWRIQAAPSCGAPIRSAPAAGNNEPCVPARFFSCRRRRQKSVTVASTIKGENTSTAIQTGKTPSLAPHRESVAASRPSVDDPVSPMNMRAGGKLKIRNPANAAAMIRLIKKRIVPRHPSHHGKNPESEHRHATGKTIHSVHLEETVLESHNPESGDPSSTISPLHPHPKKYQRIPALWRLRTGGCPECETQVVCKGLAPATLNFSAKWAQQRHRRILCDPALDQIFVLFAPKLSADSIQVIQSSE